jgi:hypothetical protein
VDRREDERIGTPSHAGSGRVLVDVSKTAITITAEVNPAQNISKENQRSAIENDGSEQWDWGSLGVEMTE